MQKLIRLISLMVEWLADNPRYYPSSMRVSQISTGYKQVYNREEQRIGCGEDDSPNNAKSKKILKGDKQTQQANTTLT
jgi:hypothetical protein